MPINVADLRQQDMGRAVTYESYTGEYEDGVVRSWNDKYIFVLYKGDLHPKATHPIHLDWLPNF